MASPPSDAAFTRRRHWRYRLWAPVRLRSPSGVVQADLENVSAAGALLFCIDALPEPEQECELQFRLFGTVVETASRILRVDPVLRAAAVEFALPADVEERLLRVLEENCRVEVRHLGSGRILHIQQGTLEGARVPGARWGGADLRRALLCESDLPAANLHGADLSGAAAELASLPGARLTGARLHHTELAGADLSEAGMQAALLRRADLTAAVAAGADLESADLGGARLVDADLRGASLRDACLWGADLRGADLQAADLKGATYDSLTLWPDGFSPEDAGARPVV